MNTFDNIARTQWFPLRKFLPDDDIKPVKMVGVIPGVYEVEVIDVVFSDFVELRKEHLFSYWDGEYWYLATNSPSGALRNRVREETEWRTINCFRGLAENPNDIHVEPWDNDEWVDPKLEHLRTVAACLKYFNAWDEKSQMKYVKEAENIIRELIQSIESTYETVA